MNIISEFLQRINWTTVPDILIVYIIIYTFLLWTKSTRSFQLMRGFFVVFLLYFASYFLQLTTLNWLLGKFTTVLLILIIIVFQPEFRRILERVGRGQLFKPLIFEDIQEMVIIKHLLKAIEQLAKQKIGALIVIEVSSNLSDYIDTGIPIGAKVSSDLMVNLFWPNTPTHDGAVIIRENKIASAGCLLPLTEKKVSDRRLGTRHRAAIGLTEETDALVIVVSEETGIISLAEGGNLTRFLTKEALETRLFNLYSEADNGFSLKNFIKIFNRKHKEKIK